MTVYEINNDDMKVIPESGGEWYVAGDFSTLTTHYKIKTSHNSSLDIFRHRFRLGMHLEFLVNVFNIHIHSVNDDDAFSSYYL